VTKNLNVEVEGYKPKILRVAVNDVMSLALKEGHRLRIQGYYKMIECFYNCIVSKLNETHCWKH
jgi:hypothetical protein